MIMKWFKGLFYPDYQSAYIFSPIDFGKIFLSFGRFNYHFDRLKKELLNNLHVN